MTKKQLKVLRKLKEGYNITSIEGRHAGIIRKLRKKGLLKPPPDICYTIGRYG